LAKAIRLKLLQSWLLEGCTEKCVYHKVTKDDLGKLSIIWKFELLKANEFLESC